MTLFALCFVTVQAFWCAAEQAEASPNVETEIVYNMAAQSLDSALIKFSQVSGFNIIADSNILKSYRSPEVVGTYSPQIVLSLLLENTDLGFDVIDQHTVIIEVNLPNTATPSAQQKSVRATTIEELYVSASRRKNKAIDLPLAVSVVLGSQFDGVSSAVLSDISTTVPGLALVNDVVQSAVLVQLRGVATTNITEIADGPVAIHIDGIYSPRSQAISGLLHDIQRVEVLRGPQGTLFGRNALAGNINIYTKRPDPSQSYGSVSLGIGNYNARSQRAIANLPLNSDVALRAAYARDYRGPFIDVIDNYVGYGSQYPDSETDLLPFQESLALGQQGLDVIDKRSLRLAVQWQPRPTSEVTLLVDRFTDGGVSGAELDPSLVNQGQRAVVLDTSPFLRLRNDTVKLEAKHQLLNGIQIDYLYGYADMYREQSFDADLGRDGSFESRRTDSSNFRFQSHELLVKSPEQQRLQALGGLFYSHENNNIVFTVDQQNPGGSHQLNTAPSWVSESAGAGVAFAIQPERRVRSAGVFGHVDVLLHAKSRLKVGVRHTRDQKSDDGGRRIVCALPTTAGPYRSDVSLSVSGPATDQVYQDATILNAISRREAIGGGSNTGIGDQPCWVQQVNDVLARWHNTSGLLSIDYSPTNQSMLYGSISTGFKSGHIQDAGNIAEPETVTNYEFGYKHEQLDSFRLNIALYQANYRNLQYSNEDRFDFNGDGVQDAGGSTIVRNASEAKVKGLEFDGLWWPKQGHRLQAVLNLTDARFHKFDIPDTLYGGVFNDFSNADETSNNDPVNLSGNRPPRTPAWTMTLQYDYQFGGFSAGVSVQLSDDYYLDIYNRDNVAAGVFESLPNGGSNLGVQQAYQRYDFRMGYQPQQANWSIKAYIKNVTDEPIKLSSGDFITENGFVANYAPPRTYGIQLSYDFK